MCFENSCNVMLIDNASYIEIHLDGDVDVLREVCPEIKRCLVDAVGPVGKEYRLPFYVLASS